MSAPFRNDIIDSLILGFFRIEQTPHFGGRWKAWLSYHSTANSFGMEPAPEGQAPSFNFDDLPEPVCSEVIWDKRGLPPPYVQPELWACRPFFKTYEAAAKKCLWWARHTRPDIVRACEAQADEIRRRMRPTAEPAA